VINHIEVVNKMDLAVAAALLQFCFVIAQLLKDKIFKEKAFC